MNDFSDNFTSRSSLVITAHSLARKHTADFAIIACIVR